MPDKGGTPVAGNGRAGQPGQEQPALEDQQASADHDPVTVTDIEAEQGSDLQDGEFEGAEFAQDAESNELSDSESAVTPPVSIASALDVEGLPEPEPHVVRTIEALLFLAPDPLTPQELSEAIGTEELGVIASLAELAERYAPGHSGIHLRELGGGFTFASDPETEEAARRLFSRPRASVLTPAQAETLAIVAYLQPISRPEITRIRGVSADSATSTLLERGLVEEAGRSQFGAVIYRTTTQFLKLFGLKSLDELPDVGQWDPSPEEEAELRDRLLRAGEARAGGGPQPELQ
ncbi:MAG TPA: SMC-Scp complex subunit ScpB [Solirubrobacteraceae bacterium]|nr:SMC-Scp complex subunit ScpB [Solirubrobacteraceae bacterium]